MTSVEVRHVQDDRFEVQVREHRFVVDQPCDAGGDDLGPTPTELFVAGLAACVGVYARRFMARHGLTTDGLGVDCTFQMAEDRPARVASVDLRVLLPESFPESRRQALLRVVDHCTVHNSILQAPAMRISVASLESVS
jgi:putative redox protein